MASNLSRLSRSNLYEVKFDNYTQFLNAIEQPDLTEKINKYIENTKRFSNTESEINKSEGKNSETVVDTTNDSSLEGANKKLKPNSFNSFNGSDYWVEMLSKSERQNHDSIDNPQTKTMNFPFQDPFSSPENWAPNLQIVNDEEKQKKVNTIFNNTKLNNSIIDIVALKKN